VPKTAVTPIGIEIFDKKPYWSKIPTATAYDAMNTISNFMVLMKLTMDILLFKSIFKNYLSPFNKLFACSHNVNYTSVPHLEQNFTSIGIGSSQLLHFTLPKGSPQY